MHLEGMLRMYAEKPDDFWTFIVAIAPVFVLGLLGGLLEESRELHGKRSRFRDFFKRIVVILILGMSWMCYIYDWFPLDDPVELGIGLVILAATLVFPLYGGAMTGMWAFKAYCWVVQLWFKCTASRLDDPS